MERSKISPLILAFTFAAGSGAGALAGAILRPDYPRSPEVDYFRRAVRSDEVFFVHTRDGVRGLVHSFLAELGTAH